MMIGRASHVNRHIFIMVFVTYNNSIEHLGPVVQSSIKLALDKHKL